MQIKKSVRLGKRSIGILITILLLSCVSAKVAVVRFRPPEYTKTTTGTNVFSVLREHFLLFHLRRSIYDTGALQSNQNVLKIDIQHDRLAPKRSL